MNRLRHPFLLLVVAAACAPDAGAGRTLTYYETYDPRSLDPAFSTDVPTGEMVTLVYDGLTQFDPRGEVHVIDVSDPEHPVYAARYEVPEAGAHNLWVEDGVMYVGYYQGGIRAVDVTGRLRGDLYRQGREIAHFLPQAGPEEARLPYAPRVWGVFPMFENGWRPSADVWFVTDYNSGLWTMKLERPEAERPIS